jgi:hypothetical protein
MDLSPLLPVFLSSGVEPWASSMLGKHSTTKLHFPACQKSSCLRRNGQKS